MANDAPDAPTAPAAGLHVVFTEQETLAIHTIAEWYAECCRRCGQPVPPDPMRAVLSCAMTTMMASAAPRGPTDETMQ